MEDELFLAGKKYVSSKKAAEITGYAKDYIGQLCRGGKLDAKLIGRNWYINLEALEKNRKRSLMLNQTVAEAVQKELARKAPPKVHHNVTLLDDLNVSFFSDDAPLMPNVVERENEPEVSHIEIKTEPAPQVAPPQMPVAAPIPLEKIKVAPRIAFTSPQEEVSRPVQRKKHVPVEQEELVRVVAEPMSLKMPSMRFAFLLGSLAAVVVAILVGSLEVTQNYTHGGGVEEGIGFVGPYAAVIQSL